MSAVSLRNDKTNNSRRSTSTLRQHSASALGPIGKFMHEGSVRTLQSHCYSGSKLIDSRLSTINVFAEGLGSLAFLGHVLGAIVAHGEVLSDRDIAAERRLRVPQPVALLKSYLGLAIACVGDPGLGAYLGCWCGQVVML